MKSLNPLLFVGHWQLTFQQMLVPLGRETFHFLHLNQVNLPGPWVLKDGKASVFVTFHTEDVIQADCIGQRAHNISAYSDALVASFSASGDLCRIEVHSNLRPVFVSITGLVLCDRLNLCEDWALILLTPTWPHSS